MCVGFTACGKAVTLHGAIATAAVAASTAPTAAAVAAVATAGCNVLPVCGADRDALGVGRAGGVRRLIKSSSTHTRSMRQQY